MHRVRSARRGRAVAGLVATLTALVLGSTACGGATGGGAGEDTWVHGILEPKVDAGYFLMARERGYFEKQGVKVEIKKFTGNVQVVQALLSGAIDSADSAPSPLYDAHLKGAEVTAIGSSLPKSTYSVLSKSSIKDFEDLQGKTIGVSAPGSYPDEIVRAMLKAKGMDAKKLKVVNAGADADRFKALLGGRVDAVAVAPGFAAGIADKPEFHVLGEASEIVPDYPRFYLWANDKALEGKPKAAVKFLAGRMQGVCYAVENPDAEKKLAEKEMGVEPNDPGVAHMNKIVTKYQAASPTSAMPMGPLEFLQKFRMDSGRQDEAVDLKAIVDGSYREKALKKAKLSEKCLDDPNAE